MFAFIRRLKSFFEQKTEPVEVVNRLFLLNSVSFRHFNNNRNCTKSFYALGKNLVEFNLFLERVLLPLFQGGRKIYPGIFTDYTLSQTTVFEYFCDSDLNYIDEVEQIELFINLVDSFLIQYQEYINDSRSKQQNLAVIHNFHDELLEFVSELIRVSHQ